MAQYGRYRESTTKVDDSHAANVSVKQCWDTNHGRSRPFASEAKIVKTRSWGQQGPYCCWYYGSALQSCTVGPAFNHAVVIQPQVPSSEDMIAEARADLFTQTFDDIESSDLGVFLATLGEAIRMVRSPFSVLSAFHKYAAYTKLPLRGNLRDVYMEGVLRFNPRKVHRLPTQVVQTMANLRLQYAYGWSPLLSDLETFGSQAKLAAEQYKPAKLALNQPLRLTGRASTVGYSSSVVSDPEQWIPYANRLGSTAESKGTMSARVKAVFALNAPAFDWDPSEKLRKGLNLMGEVARIGWELTPYSFIVDQFLPVGSFLSRVGERPVFALRGENGGAEPVLLVITRTETSNVTKYAGLSSNGMSTRIVNGVTEKGSSVVTYDRSISHSPLTVLDCPASTGLSLARTANDVSVIANVVLKRYR